MPEVGDGNKVFIYARKFGSAEAYKLLFQTEHENAPTRDRETTATKDGNVSSGGPLEDELSVTVMRPKDFETHKYFKLSVRDGIKYEFWVVYLEDSKQAEETPEGETEPITVTKYYSEYRQGYITEYSGTDGTEDSPEVELTYVPEGKYKVGYTRVPAGDEALIDYVFHEMDGTVAKNATSADEETASKTIEQYVQEDSGEETTPVA